MSRVVVEYTAPAGLHPTYETELAAGADLRANIDEPVVLAPGQRVVVPTGVRLALPPGMEAQVRPRSGLALRHGVTVLNSPGTVDADYRGEVKVILINHGDREYSVAPRERIAQLVVAELRRVVYRSTEGLNSTLRGEGGFGSTGP